MKRRLARSVGAALGAACLLAALGSVGDSGAGAAAPLRLVVGPDGHLATWLVLGPIRAPKAKARTTGGLAGWEPLGAASLEAAPEEGGRALGARWRVSGAARTYQRLAGTRPALVYLAAVLVAERPRRLWLATGGDGGLDVWLSGERLLHRSRERKGRGDLDLVALELPAGKSTLILRTWRSRRGPWSLHARLLDERFRRPRGLIVELPGAGASASRTLRQTATIDLERALDLTAGEVDVRVWLEHPGGRPIGEPAVADVSYKGPSSPSKSNVEIGLGPGDLPLERVSRVRFDGDRVPSGVEVSFGGTRLATRLGFRMRDVARLAEAASLLEAAAEHPALPRTSVESVEWRIAHLGELIRDGDQDYRYLSRELDITVANARELAAGEDPYHGHRGKLQRRGYRSAVDGQLHHYALYVPPSWREQGTSKFGLVVALHGLNSYPVKTLQTLFGIPLDENESKEHRVRHPAPMGAAPMFAVAPEAFGNSGYLAYGERDVLEVIDRVAERYRIDPARIYVTGASMGGTGAALLPLHHPGRFAATAPLCGYHSLDEYRSLRGVELHPWERFLADYRSNARWAANGRDLPLYVVHGTRDNPRHSRGLVDAYRRLGFDVTFETPDLGHNVWDTTYEGRRIFTHFRKYRREVHPRRVTLETARLRYNSASWLRVDDAEVHDAWTKVHASWGDDGLIEVTAENATALTIAADEVLAASGPPRISINGAPPVDAESADGPWSVHCGGDGWQAGPPPACASICKKPGLAGPIYDAYNEPLLFVYGTADPDETALTRRIVERMRVPRRGATVDWRYKADVEVSASDIENHSLVVVGTPTGNSLLARIAARLPIAVENGAVVVGQRRFEGDDVAVAFVHPNPLNPERYVVVHTGVTSQALFTAGHLPELLPDWLVYDGTSWARAGGLVLGADRPVLAGGFFDRYWQLAD